MQSSPVQAQAYLPTHATGGSLPSKPSNRAPRTSRARPLSRPARLQRISRRARSCLPASATVPFRASLNKGESLREDRNKGIWGQSLSQIRVISIKVRPSKSCIKTRLLTIMQPGRSKYDLNISSTLHGNLSHRQHQPDSRRLGARSGLLAREHRPAARGPA